VKWKIPARREFRQFRKRGTGSSNPSLSAIDDHIINKHQLLRVTILVPTHKSTHDDFLDVGGFP
jgi:hypothetical protein